jgi:hypothetical protein
MKVRIKTWEELLATPGVTYDTYYRSIHLNGHDSFTIVMKSLCGQIIEFDGPRTQITIDYDLGGYFMSAFIYEWMVTEIKSHNFKLIYDILNDETSK